MAILRIKQTGIVVTTTVGFLITAGDRLPGAPCRRGISGFNAESPLMWQCLQQSADTKGCVCQQWHFGLHNTTDHLLELCQLWSVGQGSVLLQVSIQ